MDQTFITYEEALGVLQDNLWGCPVESSALQNCSGAYLAEDLMADRDFPPFDRVTMDGIAIAFKEFEKGRRNFLIESVAAAGTSQITLKNTEHCVEVMTGAMLPINTDTVIRYEDLVISNGTANLGVDSLKLRQNVHFKGIDIKQGSCIVRQGQQISSAEINIAAAIGKSSLLIRKLPKMVVVSTGDELVDIDITPQPHQIRRSNVYGIQSTLKEWGVLAELAHLPDDKVSMLEMIPALLEKFEVLIFTGGVSKGKFDYLPEVLTTIGIAKKFHKIQQRPGKPFWFGTDNTNRKIFALPGNPVSSFVCLYIYVQFWLKRSMGVEPKTLYAVLGENVSFEAPLTYFLEASLESRPTGNLYAYPTKGNGSGDFANLVKTDGFLVLPQNKQKFKKGEVYPFVPYRPLI